MNRSLSDRTKFGIPGGADMTREQLAWKLAEEKAKHTVEMMYPDPERRDREWRRLAHEEYLRLMYP